jgi:hypothetical protein
MVGVFLRGILLTFVVGIAFAQVRIEELTILSVERTLDVSSQIVLSSNKIKLENTNAQPTKIFLFTVEPGLKEHLSFIGASTGNGKTGE